MSTQPWYTTREIVKLALDVKIAAQADWQIDDAIDSASREIEQATNRIFYPWTGTRYLDWPDLQMGSSYRVWLEENEAISILSLASGSNTISPSQYNLEPHNQGPPYDRIELKLSEGGSFGQSSSHQRDITATGVFGYQDDSAAAGTISAAVASTTATSLLVTDPQRIGVGNLLRIDDERLLVTDRSWVDSGETLVSDIGSLNNNVTVPVQDGTLFRKGEPIAIDSEYLRVVDIVGNALIVTRAWDGTVLAPHSATAKIYRSTSITVERGYHSRYSSGLLALILGATIVTVGAAGISTGLAQADARADHATLLAVGATPRVRRSLAASQALAIAALGSLLGFISGLVPALAYVGAIDSLTLVMPWGTLALLLLGIPAIAAAGAYLVTRSRLSLDRRMAT